jgi:hypothetical protein
LPSRLLNGSPTPGRATLDNQNERAGRADRSTDTWRAGANEATLFQVTDDVLINGQSR